jgi:predicted metalloendopeptidase
MLSDRPNVVHNIIHNSERTVMMKNKAFYFVTLMVAISIFGCKPPANQTATVSEDFIKKNVDTTISPAKDFFKYATGTWAKQNPIPPSESYWGIGNLVQEETYARLRKINEDAAKDPAATPGTPMQKIGDFYFTGMDSVGSRRMVFVRYNRTLTELMQSKPSKIFSTSPHC